LNVFCFIDTVSELRERDTLDARFRLKGTEEFLKDHFPDFPVLPGVLMLEALKQAACEFLRRGGEKTIYRLSWIEDVKFGQFVKPHGVLNLNVRLREKTAEETVFEARGELIEASGSKAKALSARFALRPVKSGPDQRS